MLLRPTKAALAYMTLWALWTASLLPLAGQGFPEFLERAGNYGVPFALLLAGLFLLAQPAWPVLVLALAWKLGTELLFPLTGDYVWEFVERAGRYGAPLGLLIASRAAVGARPTFALPQGRAAEA